MGPHRPWDLFTWPYQQQFSKCPRLCGGRAVPYSLQTAWQVLRHRSPRDIYKWVPMPGFVLAFSNEPSERERCLAAQAAQAWGSLLMSPRHIFALSITSSILPWLVLFSLPGQGWNFPGWLGEMSEWSSREKALEHLSGQRQTGQPAEAGGLISGRTGKATTETPLLKLSKHYRHLAGSPFPSLLTWHLQGVTQNFSSM